MTILSFVIIYLFLKSIHNNNNTTNNNNILNKVIRNVIDRYIYVILIFYF